MKTYTKLFFIGALLLLASCAKQENSAEPYRQEIRFSASVGTYEVKATDSVFEVGDAIGIDISVPVSVQNLQLTNTAGGLAPSEAVYWSPNQAADEQCTFLAYYPYQEDVSYSEGFEFAIQVDQSTHERYSASDFMTAEAWAAPKDGIVRLPFVHKFSKLVLSIDNRTNNQIADVYLSNVYGRASVSPTRLPAPTGTPGTVKSGAVTLSDGTPGWALVLVPQTTLPKLMITTVEGKQYSYSLSQELTFESGKRYQARITIDDSSVATDFTSDVTDWIDDADIQFGGETGAQPNNEIRYTTTNGEAVVLTSNYIQQFGANLVSNTYSEGQGIITFDKDITRVATFSFNQCKTLKSVSLPETVTSVGSGAFQSCSNLESIYLPDGITIIESAVFNGCGKLCDLVLPKGLTTIEEAAFSGCDSITTIELPEAFTTMDSRWGHNVFGGCSRLQRFSGKFASEDGRCIIMDKEVRSFAPAGITTYSVPDGVESIGGAAFEHSTLVSLNLPETVSVIKDYAFMYCTLLETLHIPEAVISVGTSAFSHCDSLASFTGKLASEDGRCLIIDGQLLAFARSGLTSYSIPMGVTGIEQPFFYCTELTNITIPEGVTYIGDEAFFKCFSLKDLVIPSTVNSLGYQVFAYTGSDESGTEVMNSLTFLSLNPPTITVNTFRGLKYDGAFYVPSESVEAYKSAEHWSDYADRIQAIPEEEQPNNQIWYTTTDGMIVEPTLPEALDASIISNTYENGKGIITFDGNLTGIGDSAFQKVSTLQTLSMPNTVTYVGRHAFEYCTGLESIHFSNQLETINSYSFYGCSALSGIEFPETLVNLGAWSFCYCSSLQAIHIPESLEGYGEGVFCSCEKLISFSGKFADESGKMLIDDGWLWAVAPEGLSSFVVPEGITRVLGGVFGGFSNLTSITLPEGLKRIGTQAFTDCLGLTELYIPDSVSALGSGVFRGCENLIYVHLPSQLTAIPSELFSHALSIKNVDIPEGVTSIGSHSFSECLNLASITLPENIASIGARAFMACVFLESITVLSPTPPSAGNDVFDDTNDCPIYVPAASLDEYKAADGWSEYADRIQAIPE